jgi:phenylacetate-CoA ligase
LDKKKCRCGRTHARSPGGILGRAGDRISCEGTSLFPSQLENVVRGFDELADQFSIELTTDPISGTDLCTVIIECLDEQHIAKVTPRLKEELKKECSVTPGIKFVPFGTLERTTFRAKRIIDKRMKSSNQ